jgi:NCS2 family nucleobase:cation symporter-2
MGVTLLSITCDRYEAERAKSTGEMMDEERHNAGALGALVEAVPQFVLGGAGIVMFGMVAATGIRILAAVDFKTNRNNLFLVAIALGFGMIPVVAPDFHMWLPKSIGPLVDSGILLASVAAVLLNLVFNGASGEADDLRKAAMSAEA